MKESEATHVLVQGEELEVVICIGQDNRHDNASNQWLECKQCKDRDRLHKYAINQDEDSHKEGHE